MAIATIVLAGLLAVAAQKSAEDFVGPATVKPLSGDSAQKAPAKGSPKSPATAATATAAPAPKGSTPAPATAAKTPPPAPAGTPAGKPASSKTGSRLILDTAHVHTVYLDGDFDQAIRILDGALKSRKSLTHGDSVFIFKHLGVIYAATPSTREKGRYYMLQLISIEPTAKILDMYASDMIYLIYRNVQEEFETKHGKSVPLVAAVDTVPAPAPIAPQDTAPAPKTAKQAGGHNTLYWVTGGTVVAAGAAGLLFILLDSPKPKKHNITLPE